MTPTERVRLRSRARRTVRLPCLLTLRRRRQLTLLRNLILWAMSSSDTVKGLVNQAYRQTRHEDDTNQPRAVQPWGSDADKRRYFLIEGQDDTHFRVYRESNPAGSSRTWWSVAGSIDELKALAEKLETKDGGPKAMKLSHKILQVIPRFEMGEEVGAHDRPPAVLGELGKPVGQ